MKKFIAVLFWSALTMSMHHKIRLLNLCAGLHAAPIEIGVGTRSQGMGSAFVGVADDASATYWNPAGLGSRQSRDGEARFMHWLLADVEDVYVDWFGASYPIGLGWGSIGVSWLRKYAKLEQVQVGDTLTTGIAENTYSLSYGIPVWEYEDKGLFVGGTVNRFSLDCDIGSGSGFGIDAGVLWAPIRVFQLGFLARNLSANKGDENFPTTYRAGIALGFQKLTLAFDLSTKEGVNGKEGLIMHYFGGLSWTPIPQFGLRLGTNENSPLNAGLGFELRRVILEYAFSSMAKEGLTNSHRIELGYRFFATLRMTKGGKDEKVYCCSLLELTYTQAKLALPQLSCRLSRCRSWML